MQISVVIPTCNRKHRLISLLRNLNDSTYRIEEVIVVDSGDERLSPADYSGLAKLQIHYIESEKSVCIQRNIGIRRASCPWVLLCDDDIEIPPHYLQKLVSHINTYSNTVAVSGVWLQPENQTWKATFPEKSAFRLFWKFIFQLSIWGEINCKTNNIILKKIKQYYQSKGNHISRAGWPVITNFSGNYFTTPLYSLGASLIKKQWLSRFPFDEVLDRHGIGDNYGVAINFPPNSIHVLNNVFVFHHRENLDRLQKQLQYFRRSLALEYFIRTNKNLHRVKKIYLLWSLKGNLLAFILSGDRKMISAGWKTLLTI